MKLKALLLSLLLPLTLLAQEKKNILFLAVDDLKPLLSNYGNEQMHTPNFDRLADMGVTLTNAHVQYAVCGPSRASIMTGARPDNTKVWDLHTDFRESAPDLMSMPEYLIQQGYQSTGVGKIYHKGSSAPGHDGKSWSIPHEIPDVNHPVHGEPAFAYYQNPDTKREMARLEEEFKAKGKKGGSRNYVFKKIKPSTESADVPDNAYQDGRYTEVGIEKMRMLAKDDRPWFLAIGWQKPHLPFVAPKKYWDLYDRDKIDLAAFQTASDGTPRIAYHNFGELRAYSDIPKDMNYGDLLPEAKQRELIHGYMACVSYIDAQLGKVLDELDRLDLKKETVIVLWGDHGFHLGDHGLWCKHSNFEQATRIPLMFAGPGIEDDFKTHHPAALVDVFPTLFEFAGVPIPAQADGNSLAPIIRDKKKEEQLGKDYVVSQYNRRKGTMGYSIRTDRYRYTEWHEDYIAGQPYNAENIVGVELYDYEKDPHETRSFAEDGSYDKVREALKGKLKAYLENPETATLRERADTRTGAVNIPKATMTRVPETVVATKPARPTKRAADTPPNILVIHTDDLGYHDLSFTGSEIYDTPNIDALAKSGRSFERAYASYPRCTPSRYGMITATYPVNEDYGHLAGIPDERQFWEVLKDRGYTTGYVGKWHLGTGENSPKAVGFDYSFAAGAAGGVDSRFYPFNGPNTKPKKYVEDVTEAGKKGDYISDLMTTATIDFMRENREEPFFAMLAFYSVHTPLEAKDEDRKRNEQQIAAYDYGTTPEYIKEGTGRRKMRQDDADYAGMVENVDENVGRLLAALREMGVAENTIIVFSSDHGGLSNDGNKRERHLATTNTPLRAGKGHLYEGGIRVPLILSGPNVVPGVDSENIVLGMDIFPTVLDLAVDKTLPGVDGQSYEPVMRGQEDWSNRTVFWNSRKARPHSTGDTKATVIMRGDWKLMHFPEENRKELYDLSTDVSEEHNLADAKPELTKELMEELKAWKRTYLTDEKMNMKKRARNTSHIDEDDDDGDKD